MITLKQGESFRIYINLNQDGQVLTPSMISDIMFCIGSDFVKTMSNGGVEFDASTGRWFIFPTQEETLDLSAGEKPLVYSVKYPDGTVIIRYLDTVKVERSICQEVF